MNKVYLIVGIFLVLISIQNVNAESYIQNNDIVNCIGKQCSMQIRSDKVYWSINHIQEDKNIDVKILDIINNDTVIFSVTNKEITTVPFSVKTNVIGNYAEQSTLKTGINEIIYKSSVDLNKLTFKFGNNSTLITLNYTKSSDDAYVRQSQADTNYGTANYIRFKGDEAGGLSFYSFIKFDISSVPAGVNITNAQLCFYVYNIGAITTTRSFHVFNKNWRQADITYNNNPCINGAFGSWNTDLCNKTNETFTTFISANFNCFNITNSAIQDYFNGSGNFSTAILWGVDSGDDSAEFYSKEYVTNTSRRPYLEITYEYPAPPQYGNVTFNIFDNNTYLSLNNLTISCNNSYVANFSSPLLHEFMYGDYNCSFTNSSYYFNQSIFSVNSNSSEINLTMSRILFNCTITFIVEDSYTFVNLTNIGLKCNSLNWQNNNSPFNVLFSQDSYNCRFNSSYYFDANKSFSCSGINFTENIKLDRQIGMTQQEHIWLKTAYFLQSVQGTEIYPTNNTCINDNTLKHEYIAEVCLNSDCSNLTIRQSSIYCMFGCITDINSFNAVCKEPDYLIWIILIIIAVIVIYIAVKVLA